MKIELTEQKSELALTIKKRANTENFTTLIKEGYGMLWNYLAELEKQISGSPYVAYFGFGEEFEIEMGFPVAEKLSVKGEFSLSETYEGRVVTGIYKGSYKGLAQAYEEIFKYIEENSLKSTGIYYDYYINDPSNTPEDELLTKIVIPIK